MIKISYYGFESISRSARYSLKCSSVSGGRWGCGWVWSTSGVWSRSRSWSASTSGAMFRSASSK